MIIKVVSMVLVFFLSSFAFTLVDDTEPEMLGEAIHAVPVVSQNYGVFAGIVESDVSLDSDDLDETSRLENNVYFVGVPYDCYGVIDNVHKSKYGAFASVHGRTACLSGSGNYISLSIGYTGWFGECYGVQYNDGAGPGGNVAKTQVKSDCGGKGVQNWRAFGYYSTFHAGKHKYATPQEARFEC